MAADPAGEAQRLPSWEKWKRERRQEGTERGREVAPCHFHDSPQFTFLATPMGRRESRNGKRPSNWFFAMCKLTRQTIKSNFYDFCAKTLPHATSKPFACDINKPTTTEQHLLMTCSTEHIKIHKNGLNKLRQQNCQFILQYIIVSYF